jgi:hypothetical protein
MLAVSMKLPPAQEGVEDLAALVLRRFQPQSSPKVIAETQLRDPQTRLAEHR